MWSHRTLAVVGSMVLTIGVAAGGPAGAAGSAPEPSTARAVPGVNWNGWQGARFGMSLEEAQGYVGGEIQETSWDPQCGDVLATRTAFLSGTDYEDPHGVGSISAAPGTTLKFPLGITIRMSAREARQRVDDSGYTRKGRAGTTAGHYPERQVWVVGPHGHTLYYDYRTKAAGGDGGKHLTGLGVAADEELAKKRLDNYWCR